MQSSYVDGDRSRIDRLLSQMPNTPLTNDQQLDQLKYMIDTCLCGYADHLLDPQFDRHILEFLGALLRFQRRQHAREPQKSKAKRRLVFGAKECRTLIDVNKIKCLIVGVDLDEECLVRDTCELLALTRSNAIPVFFSLTRAQLGFGMVGKKTSISMIGILSTDGAHEAYTHLVKHHEELKEAWREHLLSLRDYESTGNLTLYAAQFNHAGFIQPAQVNSVRNDTGMSPLMLASRGGHRRLIEQLLELNADVNAVDFMLRNALHYAVCANRADLVDCLVAAGCMNRPDASGTDALLLAANEASGDCLARLLEAHPPRQDLAIAAAKHKSADCLALLLSTGFAFEVGPVFVASAQNDSVCCIRALAKHASDRSVLNWTDGQGRSAIWWAAYFDCRGAYNELLYALKCDHTATDNQSGFSAARIRQMRSSNKPTCLPSP